MKNPLADGSIGDLHGQMRELVRNPFRNKIMKQQYDAAVQSYDTKHNDLIYATGRRCLGNGWAGAFWRGFDGLYDERWKNDAGARQTPGYACWRAGKDIRAALDARAADTPTTKSGSESVSLSFGGGTPTPADPECLVLAEEALDIHDSFIGTSHGQGYRSKPVTTEFDLLLNARDNLHRAKDEVPDYTGQWKDSDYYPDEQEAYNRAVDAYGNSVRSKMTQAAKKTKGKTDV